MITLHARAYAKLNLYLEVTGKRTDGYHELETVMQTVSLCDELELLLGTENGWRVTSDCGGVPEDEKNLCWRAAERFFEAVGSRPDGLEIRIRKRIPMGAGLAGGSADAAAVLRALNAAYRAPLSVPELCDLGAAVGSDVPFCVLGGTAFAGGRGELLRAVSGLPHAHYVICKPEESLSTAEMFAFLDAFPRTPRFGAGEAVCCCENPAELAARLYNAFEPAAVTRLPQIEELRQELLACGALGARMSGSGPSVFGLFDRREQAEEAYGLLRGKCRQTFLCETAEFYQ